MNKLIIPFLSLFLLVSCEKSAEIIQKPLIRFQEPSLNIFSIGENIPINISINILIPISINILIPIRIPISSPSPAIRV